MSTINFPSAQNGAQNNSNNVDFKRVVFTSLQHTHRFFVYGVETREEAARTLNDYLSKKGTSFTPCFARHMSDPFVSDWRAHQIEVDRLKAHPEEIDDGTGEPGKISYVEEVFFTRVMKYIAQDPSTEPKVLEFQSYTLVYGHRFVEFWAHESIAAEMAREVVFEDYLLECANDGRTPSTPIENIKSRGLWLPTEMFLDENGNFDVNQSRSIFDDLITKEPLENLPLIHHTLTAIFSQKRVVECMDFRFFYRFLTSYTQPLIPDWLVEFKLYCIDFKGADIEFHMYHRLDPGVEVNPSIKKAFPDLGMTGDEADDAINKYAAENNGTVTVISYTRDGDFDPYAQADKFVDFLQKATEADGIKDGVDDTSFMKILYFFLWLVKEIPNIELDDLQEMAKGLKVGQVAKFLLDHPFMVDFTVTELVNFISRVKFLSDRCQFWYDPDHHDSTKYNFFGEPTKLPGISFACDFRRTLKNLFNVV